PNLFMLSLGPGAAAESLLGWLLFGAVLLAGLTPTVSARALALAVAAAVLAAAIALLAPTFIARADAGRVVEGRLAALPAGAGFISGLPLPPPAGGALGPPNRLPGVLLVGSGTAAMEIDGNGLDVGPG